MMDELLKKHKVLICAGSGGVGKTTIAASMAVRAAELGLKVLVLTIDPSMRLAHALGISRESFDDVLVPNQSFAGKLFAAVLNSKKVFDDFVRASAGNAEHAEKFMKNRLYVQLSTRLSGSQEFTALQRLYAGYQSGQYDLVILDTPPTKHAVDFLKAPQKINAMFTQSISGWILDTHEKSKSMFSRFFGPTQIFNIFKKITGAQFVEELVDFFSGIQSWQEKVRQRTIEVHRLLTSESTGFVLISSFDSNKMEEAKYFYREIQKGGHHLVGVVINRALPVWAKSEQVENSADADIKALLNYYNDFVSYYQSRENAFLKFHDMAEKSITFVRVPDFNQEIGGLENLKEIAQQLVRGVTK